jgi:hypothetical protein
VANENLGRAGRLLETLEQDLAIRLPEESESADSSDQNEDSDITAALGHHAATAAAVVASIRRGQGPGGENGGTGAEAPGANTNTTTESGRPIRRPLRNLE